MRKDHALTEIEKEFERAISIFPEFNSDHEGYAVILEELDELWDEIKKPRDYPDRDALRKEAIQVAAMSLRFLVDCA